MEVFALIPCFIIGLALAQIGMAVIALIQVLTHGRLTTEKKILWAAVSWFVPVLGPILYWTIGQHDYPGSRES